MTAQVCVMGSGARPKTPKSPETGLEPHFHVTDVEFEVSADGAMIISLYESRRGELKLQATLSMMPMNVIKAAREAATIAAEAHNMAEFAKALDDGKKGH